MHSEELQKKKLTELLLVQFNNLASEIIFLRDIIEQASECLSENELQKVLDENFLSLEDKEDPKNIN